MAKSVWNLDSTHSSVDFSLKHMMISKVKGTFKEFSAQIEADPADLTTASINFDIQVASVDTRNSDRDNHLRAGDFFDAEAFPTMNFVATKIVKTDDGEYDVTGNFRIKDVTREETFAVVFEGEGKDPWGQRKVGFSVEGKINRGDFGLVYNAVLETGGVLISDTIKISLDIQAVIA